MQEVRKPTKAVDTFWDNHADSSYRKKIVSRAESLRPIIASLSKDSLEEMLEQWIETANFLLDGVEDLVEAVNAGLKGRPIEAMVWSAMEELVSYNTYIEGTIKNKQNIIGELQGIHIDA